MKEQLELILNSEYHNDVRKCALLFMISGRADRNEWDLAATLYQARIAVNRRYNLKGAE